MASLRAAKSVSSLGSGLVTAATKVADIKVMRASLKSTTLLGAEKASPTVVVGPSGIGKGTLLTKLRQEFASFAVAVSHTTRTPRPGEVDGISYNFVTREEFEAMIKNNGFIEHAEFGGNMYGTSFGAVEDVSKEGQICLLEIDLQGAKSIKAYGIGARFIFITTAGDALSILTDRLQKRGSESKEQVEKRLATAHTELKFVEENPAFFDLVLENDDLEEAYKKLISKLGTWYQLKTTF